MMESDGSQTHVEREREEIRISALVFEKNGIFFLNFFFRNLCSGQMHEQRKPLSYVREGLALRC